MPTIRWRRPPPELGGGLHNLFHPQILPSPNLQIIFPLHTSSLSYLQTISQVNDPVAGGAEGGFFDGFGEGGVGMGEDGQVLG
jgi:hypothetical protein